MTKNNQPPSRKPTKAEVQAAERRAMERSAITGSAALGNQIPRTARRTHAAAHDSGGYAKLRIRVEDGSLSIVDIHHVDSELDMPDTLVGQNAYELTLDDTLIHADSVIDVGVSRSFPNPDPHAPPEQRGHHIQPLDSYEFDVRVPLERLTRTNLERVKLRYFRLGDRIDVEPRGSRVAADRGTTAENIGEIVGLPQEVLGR